jgi:hypothetical protein
MDRLRQSTAFGRTGSRLITTDADACLVAVP